MILDAWEAQLCLLIQLDLTSSWYLMVAKNTTATIEEKVVAPCFGPIF